MEPRLDRRLRCLSFLCAHMSRSHVVFDRKPHTLDFYIRRVFRIYPLAIVAILALLAFRLPYSSDQHHFFTQYHPHVWGVLENLLLIQNIGLSGGYVLGVLWSLPLEVDMYVLLPVIYFFVRKNFSIWPLLVLWSLACGLARTSLLQGNNFATVIPCFLPGVMAYVLFAHLKPRFPAWTFPLYIVLLLIFFMHFSRVAAAWPTCLALGLGLPLFRQITVKPFRRVCHELAKYSYGIYLGHVFAVGIVFYTLKDFGFWLKLPLEFALIAIFAFLGYHLVERPMIKLGTKLAAKAELRYEQHQHI
jgi:peptidoglycan/LPS O-acetylase OafA/YrhL